MKSTKRTFMGLLARVVSLAGSGVAYQAITAERSTQPFVVSQLVDVGGYHLRLNVMGEAKGGPAVMLDSGAQSASFQWGWVQPQIAEVRGWLPTTEPAPAGARFRQTHEFSRVTGRSP